MGRIGEAITRGRPGGNPALSGSPSGSDTITIPRSLALNLQASFAPFFELMELTTGSDDATVDFSESGYGYCVPLEQRNFDRLKELSDQLEKLCQ